MLALAGFIPWRPWMRQASSDSYILSFPITLPTNAIDIRPYVFSVNCTMFAPMRKTGGWSGGELDAALQYPGVCAPGGCRLPAAVLREQSELQGR